MAYKVNVELEIAASSADAKNDEGTALLRFVRADNGDLRMEIGGQFRTVHIDSEDAWALKRFLVTTDREGDGE